MYAFHLFLGHHGVLSLTPIWVLAVGGLCSSVFGTARRGRWRLTLVVSLAVYVVFAAVFAWIVNTANYGGWTSGPRWFFWLTPLWLLALLPAADRVGTASGVAVVAICCCGVRLLGRVPRDQSVAAPVDLSGS